jgi:2-hydroxy-6-oxonona-2,4-dienedioate hydrolase
MSEMEVEVNGGIVVYELVGPEDGQVVTLTPGGRFSKDFPGVRPLADALAAGGKRVLLWDRPNTGKSDIQMFGESESHMRAQTLGAMVQKLELGPVVALGGSGGARDSIVFTLLYPELVKKLGVWSIVGGNYSSMSLAGVYNMSELRTIRSVGIEGILEMPGIAGSWPDLVAANPRNRERLLAIGTEEFERVMNRWFSAFIPKPNESIPGVPDWQFEQIKVPTLIIRGGEKDFDHPKRTSYEVYCLIKGSRLIEPPWPEDAWEQASKARNAGRGSIFDPWVKAAPVLLDFIDEPVAAPSHV